MARLRRQTLQKEVFDDTQAPAPQVIKLKGGAGFAVGLSIREVIDAIALDAAACCRSPRSCRGLRPPRRVLVGADGIGCGGVRKQIELALIPKERLGLQNSGRVLRETIDQVMARIGSGSTPAAKPQPVSHGNGRAIPRAAWQVTVAQR